jgi:Spy/CpxP family protein refolding chaperone
MKRLWLLILLVSVGLNLGLAWQMWKEGDGTKGLHARHEGRWSKNQERHWPAKGDSAAWHRMGHERMDRVSSRLELDQEQAEAFRESHAETIHRLGDKRALVRESRDELRALMAEGVIDSTAVRATLHELGRRQAVLDSLVAESFMAELSVLDPEQRAHYLQMMPFGGSPGFEGRPGRGRGGHGHD